MAARPPRGTPTSPARRVALVSLVLAAGLVLLACTGVQPVAPAATGGAPSINDSGRVAGDPGGQPAPRGLTEPLLVGLLPDPEPGVVRVDGAVGALADRATAAYLATSSTRVERTTTGATRAFERLCLGEIDVVDAPRPLTPTEWEACHAVGLDVVQLQVGADAAVLAVRRGSDVGTDCLGTDDLEAMFAAGSTLTRWTQVDATLEDLPLLLGGPGPTGVALTALTGVVLGEVEPTLDDLAARYRAFADPSRTVRYLAGDGTLGVFRQGYARRNDALLRTFEVEAADGEEDADGEESLGCVLATPETVLSGAYPLAHPLLLTTTTRALKRREVADYLASYLRSTPGLAPVSGTVAVGADVLDRQLGWVTEGTYPAFASVDGGPVTEVEPSRASAPSRLPVETPAP